MTATHTADPGTSPDHHGPASRKLPKELVAKSNSDFSRIRNIAIVVLIAVVVAVIALVAIATYIVNPIVAAQDGTPAATTTTTPAPATTPAQVTPQTAAPAAAPQQQATAWPAPGTQMEPTGCYGGGIPRTLTVAGEVFNPYNCQLRFIVEEGCIDILDRAGEPLLTNFCTNHGTVDLSLPMYWVRATTGTARITRNWCPPNSLGNYVDTCN